MAQKLKENGVTIIINSLIPVKGFVAMNLFGRVLYRKEYWNKDSDYSKQKTINHERIHTVQILEKAMKLKKYPKLQLILGGIVFYASYLWQCVLHGYAKNPYEIEAYAHQDDFEYKKDIA